MTSGSVYSEFSNDGRGRCLKICCILFAILGLSIFCISGGILGAYLYDNYIEELLGGDDNNDNNNNNSNGKNSTNNNNSNHKHGGSEELIFEDNFDTLDLSIWKHVLTASGGGNWEFEYYTNNRSNSYVRNGILYIKPTLTNNTYTDENFLTTGTLDLWGGVPADICTSNSDYGCERTGSASNALNSVQSARIRTAESFSFKYGRVEVSAQLPKGDWLWPAIWMLPRYNYYGQWPASGEIDIIEARGNYNLDCSGSSDDSLDGSSIGIHQMGTTLHWGPYYGADLYNMTHMNITLKNGKLFCDDFHNFTMQWSENGFVFYLDGTSYLNVSINDIGGFWKYGKFDKSFPNSFNPWNDTTGNSSINAPFDQEFFFVMNLAAGGAASGYWPDGCISNPDGGLPSYTKPWSDASTTAYADFWNGVESWYPTWYPFENNGESAALKVDYIRVYQYK